MKSFFLTTGFICCVLASAVLLGEEFVCESVSNEVRQCGYIEHHISGPMIVKEWLKGTEKDPYLREI